jgi:hypothetical protein
MRGPERFHPLKMLRAFLKRVSPGEDVLGRCFGSSGGGEADIRLVHTDDFLKVNREKVRPGCPLTNSKLVFWARP